MASSDTVQHAPEADHSGRARVAGRWSNWKNSNDEFLLYDRENCDGWMTAENPAELEANR